MPVNEFPGLQIDDFRTSATGPPPSLCLLTHSHSDHLNGLEKSSYYGPVVHCSKATRAMVLNLRGNKGSGDLKYAHLRKEVGGREWLVGLDLDLPHYLLCQGDTLEVTLIDANHCPGAVMFLVRDKAGKSVLFTGDTRCEAWHVNALGQHPQLLPYTMGRKPISVYVDDTFEQHADPYFQYVNSESSVNELISLLDKGYPAQSSFAPIFSTTGYERVLISLAVSFDAKVHMDPYYYNLYLAAADTSSMARTLVSYCTADPMEARIHWCRKGGGCEARGRKDTVFFSPCVTICKDAVDERNRPLRMEDFDVAGACDLPVFCNTDTGARYILSTDSKSLLPGHLLFYYSRHASRQELRGLLDIFRVRSVHRLNGELIPSLSSAVNTQASSSSDSKTPDDKVALTAPVHQAPPELKIYRKQGPNRYQGPKSQKRKWVPSSSDSSSSHDDILAFLNNRAVVHLKMADLSRTTLEREPTAGENSDKNDLVSRHGSTQTDEIRQDRPEDKSFRFPQRASMEGSLLSPQSSPDPPHSKGTTEHQQHEAELVSKYQELAPALMPEFETLLTAEPAEVPTASSQLSVRATQPILESTQRLEESLRDDPTRWFSLNFDWRSGIGD